MGKWKEMVYLTFTSQYSVKLIPKDNIIDNYADTQTGCTVDFFIAVNLPQVDPYLNIYDEAFAEQPKLLFQDARGNYTYSLKYLLPFGLSQVNVTVVDRTETGYKFTYTQYLCEKVPDLSLSIREVKTTKGVDPLTGSHYYISHFSSPDLKKRIVFSKFTCSISAHLVLPYECIFDNIDLSVVGIIPLKVQYKNTYETLPDTANVDIVDPSYSVVASFQISRFFPADQPDAVISPLTPLTPNSTHINDYWDQRQLSVLFTARITNFNSFMTLFSSSEYFSTYNIYPAQGNPQDPLYIGILNLNGIDMSPINTNLAYFKNNQIVQGDIFSYSYSSLEQPTVTSFTYITAETTDSIFPDLPGSGIASIKVETTFSPYVQLYFSQWTTEILVAFPYGITNGTIKNYVHSGDYMLPDYIPKTSSIYFNFGISFLKLNNTKSSVEDSVAPTIEELKIIELREGGYLYQVRAKDDLSGIVKIVIGDSVLTESNLVYGNLVEGYFEYYEPFHLGRLLRKEIKPIVQLYDAVGNRRTYDADCYLLPFLPIPKYPIYEKIFTSQYSYNSIVGISFENNYVDVSNGSVANTMYISIANGDMNIAPVLVLLPKKTIDSLDNFEKLTFIGSYNLTSEQFHIPFKIPGRIFSGSLDYILYVNPFSYTSGVLGSKYQGLHVVSENADQIPPLITNITPFSQTDIVIEPILVGWNITIEDSINGLEFAQINITSDYSYDVASFILTPTSNLLVSGDQFKGVYQLSIPIKPTCRTQTFKISTVYTRDIHGNEAGSNLGPRSINPLSPVLDGYAAKSSVAINCNYQDTVPPQMLDMRISHTSVNTGLPSLNRTIQFNLVVTDDLGLLETSLPSIYLQTLNGVQFDFKCPLLSITGDQKQANYECKYTVPYGAGQSRGFLVSVYGLTDMNMNMNGYSSGDLKLLSLPWRIESTEFLPFPEIERITNPIYMAGGSVTIYGNGFGPLERSVEYDLNGDGNWELAVPSFESSVVIGFDLPRLKGPTSVRMVAARTKVSNVITFIPIDYTPPTPPPSPSTSPNPTESASPSPPPPETASPFPPRNKCPGEPQCGGSTQGECHSERNYQCICKDPWYGEDCQLQIIDTQTPKTNETSPTITPSIDIPSDGGGGKTTYTSFITVRQLNELGPTGKVLRQHILSSWTLESFHPSGDSTHDVYSTNFTHNGITTVVNTTIRWFNNPQSISFADRTFLLPKSTAKYNIHITKYGFEKSLHSLQLVMEASFKSSQTDSCSNKDFGQTADTEFQIIQLQVNSHMLQGKYLNYAEIDGRTQVVNNILLDENLKTTHSDESQTYIGTNMRYFEEYATIDPDYSILVNSRRSESNELSTCKKKKTGLTTTQLAGIIVGVSAAGLATIIGGTFYYLKKRKQKHSMKMLQNKLKNVNK
eukprot:gene4038-5054_t